MSSIIFRQVQSWLTDRDSCFSTHDDEIRPLRLVWIDVETMQFDLPVLGKKELSQIVQAMRAELADWLGNPNCQKKAAEPFTLLKAAIQQERREGLLSASDALADLFYWNVAEGVDHLLGARIEKGEECLRRALYFENASADFSVAFDTLAENRYVSQLSRVTDWVLAFFLSEVLGQDAISRSLAAHIHGYYETGVIVEIIDDESFRDYVSGVVSRYRSTPRGAARTSLGVFSGLVATDLPTPEQLNNLTRYHVMRVDQESPYATRKGIAPVFCFPGLDVMPVEILAAKAINRAWSCLAGVNALLDLWSAVELRRTESPVSDLLVQSCYRKFGVTPDSIA